MNKMRRNAVCYLAVFLGLLWGSLNTETPENEQIVSRWQPVWSVTIASRAASSLVLGNPLWEVGDTRRFSVYLSIKRRLCTVISGEFLELLEELNSATTTIGTVVLIRPLATGTCRFLLRDSHCWIPWVVPPPVASFAGEIKCMAPYY